MRRETDRLPIQPLCLQGTNVVLNMGLLRGPPPFFAQMSRLTTHMPGREGLISACSGIQTLVLCRVSMWPS